MEINNQISNLDLINMDNYRPSSYSAAVKDPQKFEDMLKRHYDSQPDMQTRPGEGPIDKNDKLFQLCLELETFLVKNLLTSMRNTVQKSGLVEEGFAGKMYEDMLYDEYAKDLTKNAGFGLAEQAYNQLKRLQ